MHRHCRLSSAGQLVRQELRALWAVCTSNRLRKPLLSSSLHDAVHGTLKDYVQPVLVLHGAAVLAQAGYISTSDAGTDTAIKVVLGCIYTLFYLVSSLGTSNAYRLAGAVGSDEKRVMDLLFYSQSALLLLIAAAIWLKAVAAVPALYLLLFLCFNLRKPNAVTAVADLMGAGRRATVNSADAMLKSMFMLVLAPACGYIAHVYSIQVRGPAVQLCARCAAVRVGHAAVCTERPLIRVQVVTLTLTLANLPALLRCAPRAPFGAPRASLWPAPAPCSCANAGAAGWRRRRLHGSERRVSGRRRRRACRGRGGTGGRGRRRGRGWGRGGRASCKGGADAGAGHGGGGGGVNTGRTGTGDERVGGCRCRCNRCCRCRGLDRVSSVSIRIAYS
jgi:hypothetical protein